MKPFLSIIIPVYKIKEEYLRACFDSLISQDMNEFRVIVVDDGSPDNCGHICDEYAGRDSRFMITHQKNAGVAAARNVCLDAVETEWITFVDPDDWVEHNLVSTLYNAIQSRPECDIFLFDYVQELAKKKIVKELMSESQKLNEEWSNNLKLAPFNHFVVDGKPFEYETNTLWDKMYRTSMIESAHLRFDFRARKGQDVIFNAECLQLTDKFYYIHAPLYHYRYLEDSITNKFNKKVQYYNEVAFDNYERIIKKYHLPDKYKEAFYARVVTRVYSTMRLYYFHPENTATWKQVTKQLNSTLDNEPYCTALKKVDYSYLTGSQELFVHFLKRRHYRILRLLVNCRQIWKNLKGAKLK